jgi:hypothetical protein
MNHHDTTRHAADLFSMTRAAHATPAITARIQPRPWVCMNAITEESAAAAITRAGFSVSPIVDKYGVKRWEFVDVHGHAWMLPRDKFLKTGWLYS